ncbi:MAG: hypothetical protein NVS9B4_10220 [Candidatus Acidiferrum sp.]
MAAANRPENHRALAAFFRALADPTRLRLLNLIADREICVCYFVQVLGVTQPKISRHLAYLRRAGLVAARRQGKWMHYRLAMPKDNGVASVLREALRVLKTTPEMQQDVARLSSACCSPQKYLLLQGAPRPAAIPKIRGKRLEGADFAIGKKGGIIPTA